MINSDKIMVTRPFNNIRNSIPQKNFIYFPLIKIHRLNITSLFDKLKKIANIDIMIFISKNAINTVMPTMIKSEKFLNIKKTIYITIGYNSAVELKRFGIKKILFSKSKYPNSNKILNLNILKKVNKKRIIIFKGNDGKDILCKGLKKRNAIVFNVISYYRCMPKFKEYINFINSNIFSFIFLTSVESLKNFFFLSKKYKKTKNFNKTILIVTSKKIRNLGYFLGFKKIFVSFYYKETNILNDLKNSLLFSQKLNYRGSFHR